MTNDDHLGSRRAETELQHTSKFVEAINKHDVIWRFTEKYEIIKRLESHGFLNNLKPSLSSPKFTLSVAFFFSSLHPCILLFRYLFQILKCSLIPQIYALTFVIYPVRLTPKFTCSSMLWRPLTWSR